MSPSRRDITNPRVAVIVPTRNSARTIEACLRSLRQQTETCTIVVVDNHSTDGTPALAEPFVDVLLSGGPERSAQRNLGAQAVSAQVIGFIDSDMILASRVVEEAADAISNGAGSVIVPERTIGDGYWATVRAFERSFYGGSDAIESARFFREEVFRHSNGFDENLTGAEDLDMTIRARVLGPIERITSVIEHDEGRVRFVDACRKKGYYAEGIRRYASKHGVRTVGAMANRPYLSEPWRLIWPRPLLGIGLVALKTGEVLAVIWALLRSQPNSRERLSSRIWHRSGKLAFVREVDTLTKEEIPDRFRWAISWAGSLKNKHVADIGCWTGSFLEYLMAADKPDALVGVDLPGPWLEAARARLPEITFAVAESLLLPLEVYQRSFDRVFFLETLEHLPRGSESQVLKNLASLLTDDGELILSTPALGFAAVTDPAWLLVGHRHYTYMRLRKLCMESGLDIQEVGYSGNIWSIIDTNVFYFFKHVLHQNRHVNPILAKKSNTGIGSKRTFTTNNVWLRVVRT